MEYKSRHNFINKKRPFRIVCGAHRRNKKVSKKYCLYLLFYRFFFLLPFTFSILFYASMALMLSLSFQPFLPLLCTPTILTPFSNKNTWIYEKKRKTFFMFIHNIGIPFVLYILGEKRILHSHTMARLTNLTLPLQ